MRYIKFLTTFVLSLMKSLDIRSEPAVRLLAEFLDLDSGGERLNAEHFAHELYSYLRSPYRDLAVYDTVVQYDVPENVPAPAVLPQRARRWRSRSRSFSRPRSRSRSRSRSHSRPRSISRGPSRSLSGESTRLMSPSRSLTPASRSPSPYPRSSRLYPISPHGRKDHTSSHRQAGEERETHSPRHLDRHSRERLPSRRNSNSREGGREGRVRPPTRDRNLDYSHKGKGREERISRSRPGDDRARRKSRPLSPRRQQSSTNTYRDHAHVSTAHINDVATASLALKDSDDVQPNTPALDTHAAASPSGEPPTERPQRSLNDASSGDAVCVKKSQRRTVPAQSNRRSLVESVQMHLSIRGASGGHDKLQGYRGQSSTSSVPNEQGAISSRKGRLPGEAALSSRVPSLLLRLSDPTPTMTESTSREEPAPQRASAGAARNSATGLQASSVLPPEPETARAKDSLVKRNFRLSDSDLTAAGPRSLSQCVDEEASPLQPPKVKPDGCVTPLASSDLRAALLSKLAHEKRISSHTAAMDDVGSQSNPENADSAVTMRPATAFSVQETTNSVGPLESAASQEGRLRSQARLRIRLAAARKAALSSAVEHDNANDDIVPTSLEAIGADDSLMEKEELLRARLIGRQT
ncbi:uncharacterized protein FIBRA_00018 [Fibroporia radiculosa]|uniref:Uncharacterized protein n=1 Tax=Fibroporia radiculosa TaxID=599839 RepID=J7RUN7_9APHY|nr:uncharacterized protein FIBRA_00018 [Fibroporia radiculosa]CCL98025.1 predicted protein [Fibroporia radiculosa]